MKKNWLRKKKIMKKIINKNIENKEKIIIFLGNKKSGKTTIIFLLIYYLINKNKLILLINSDKKIAKKYFNNYKSSYKNKYKEIKIKKNFYILNEIREKKSNKKNIDFNKKYNKKYDYILVDTKNRNDFYKYNKLIKNNDKIILILEGKTLGIKEIKDFIEKQEENLINKDAGLHIIANKYYFNSINFQILKNIFKCPKKIHIIYKRNLYKNILQKFINNKEIQLNKKIQKILSEIIK